MHLKYQPMKTLKMTYQLVVVVSTIPALQYESLFESFKSAEAQHFWVVFDVNTTLVSWPETHSILFRANKETQNKSEVEGSSLLNIRYHKLG